MGRTAVPGSPVAERTVSGHRPQAPRRPRPNSPQGKDSSREGSPLPCTDRYGLPAQCARQPGTWEAAATGPRGADL